MVQRILINRSIGGFSLSKAAMLWLIEREHPIAIEEMKFIQQMNSEYPTTSDDNWYSPQIPRTDPLLLACFEALGSLFLSEERYVYKIVEVPDGVEWDIESSEEGYEWVAEKHRTWL